MALTSRKIIIFIPDFFEKYLLTLKTSFLGFSNNFEAPRARDTRFSILYFWISKYAKNNENKVHYDPNEHCNFAVMMMVSLGFSYKPYLLNLKTLFPMVSNNFESSEAGFSDYPNP